MINLLRRYLCKSPLKGWGVQSTKEGFNGDILTGDSIMMVSHTNPSYTFGGDSWKDNRVEIHKEISEESFNWNLKVKFHRLPDVGGFIIFSQIWNLKHNNVLCLTVRRVNKESILLSLDKKQDNITSRLWSAEYSMDDTHEIALLVNKESVSGCINNLPIGEHVLEVFTESPSYVKHGFYWSETIPFVQANRMIAEYYLED